MKKNQKGFTLVELIVVIAVLALLAVGAVLAFQGIQANARRSNVVRAASNLATALNTANTTAGGRTDVTFLHHASVTDNVNDSSLAVPTLATTGAPTQAAIAGNAATAQAVALWYDGPGAGNPGTATVYVTVPASSGLGAEVLSVSFNTHQDMVRAFNVVGVPVPSAGSPPNAFVNNPAIEAWDSIAATIAW